MSIYVQAWVYQHSEARLADRLVLLAIADEADDDGTNAFPSQRRLAEKARLGQTTVRRAIESLEAAGEILVERPERIGRGRFSTYTVVMGRSPAELEGIQSEHLSGPAKRAETRRNAPERGADPLTHKPIDLDLRDTSTSLTVVYRSGNPVDIVFDAWRDATGHRRAILDDKRRRVIEKALRHYPPGDCVDACWGVTLSPHHQGATNGTRYDDISLILRDAEHVERFRDLWRNEAQLSPLDRLRQHKTGGATVTALEKMGYGDQRGNDPVGAPGGAVPGLGR